jgi:hypothetical protein
MMARPPACLMARFCGFSSGLRDLSPVLWHPLGFEFEIRCLVFLDKGVALVEGDFWLS